MTAQADVRTESGATIRMDLPLNRHIQARVDKGYLHIVKVFGDVEKPDEPTRPAVNDPKAAWVGWAVHSTRDAETPVTPDEADGMTKGDLIDRFG